MEEAAEMVTALPAVTQGERHGNRTWFVSGKAFAWDRPFSKADLKRFGDEIPPDGPILALRVEDLDEKRSVLAQGLKGFFDIEHFNAYPAFLIQLKVVGKRALRQAILDAWLATAPRKLAEEHLK